MDYRMDEYEGIACRVHLKPIEQHLIYYGPGEPKNIKGGIRQYFYTYEYKVHNIYGISYKEFLKQSAPESVIFAIWANPEGVPAETIIELIVERLRELEGDDEKIRKFINQLVVLSQKA